MKKPGAPAWPYSQKDVARYIVKLAEAHDDCADKLLRIDSLLKLNDSEITAFNAQRKSTR